MQGSSRKQRAFLNQFNLRFNTGIIYKGVGRESRGLERQFRCPKDAGEGMVEPHGESCMGREA